MLSIAESLPTFFLFLAVSVFPVTLFVLLSRGTPAAVTRRRTTENVSLVLCACVCQRLY